MQCLLSGSQKLYLSFRMETYLFGGCISVCQCETTVLYGASERGSGRNQTWGQAASLIYLFE